MLVGGPGSGRWGDYQKREIVEYSLMLDIDALVRAGLDPSSEACSGSISLQSSGGGPEGISLDYWLAPNFGQPLLTVCCAVGGNWPNAILRLQRTRPHFGGVRWWFTCPSPSGRWCNRRVGKLYLPPGAVYFGCRQCHGLTYWTAQTHDKRVNDYRAHPEKLASVISAALDPKAASKRRLAFKALRWLK